MKRFLVFSILYFPSFIATAIATAQKTVNGGMLSFPTSRHAEKFNLKTLLGFAESGCESPATTVVGGRRYASANRDAVLRFLKAYFEGTKRLLTDRAMLATTHDLFASHDIKKIPKINLKASKRSSAWRRKNAPKPPRPNQSALSIQLC